MRKNKEMIFNFGERVISFKVGDFEEDLDLDKLLKIDYSNLFAEIVTFPVVVNRLGLLAAEMDNLVKNAKLNLDVFEAKERNRIRSNWEGAKKPTIDEVDSSLICNPKYILKTKNYNELIRDKEYLYVVYQSAKDKSEKLNKLSLQIKPGDMDESIIQNQINKVYFKIKNGRFTSKD